MAFSSRCKFCDVGIELEHRAASYLVLNARIEIGIVSVAGEVICFKA
jgi:hypothetical protein